MNTINGTSHPRRDYTYLVRVSLPNDYASEDGNARLTYAFLRERESDDPVFSPSDIYEWAFDELHSLWPGLVWIQDTDFGAIFRATKKQPADLPPYYWVSSVA